MKKTVFTFVLFLLTASLTCVAQDKKATTSTAPEMQLTETNYDFGTVKEGPDYTHVFKVKNTGDAPLVINKVVTPCGCTSPKWSNEPILPGKTGEITATFHSAGRLGVFTKTLSVQTNLGEGKDQFVTIRGEVKPASQGAGASGSARGN